MPATRERDTGMPPSTPESHCSPGQNRSFTGKLHCTPHTRGGGLSKSDPNSGPLIAVIGEVIRVERMAGGSSEITYKLAGSCVYHRQVVTHDQGSSVE